jgi:hypothetical protein
VALCAPPEQSTVNAPITPLFCVEPGSSVHVGLQISTRFPSQIKTTLRLQHTTIVEGATQTVVLEPRRVPAENGVNAQTITPSSSTVDLSLSASSVTVSSTGIRACISPLVMPSVASFIKVVLSDLPRSQAAHPAKDTPYAKTARVIAQRVNYTFAAALQPVARLATVRLDTVELGLTAGYFSAAAAKRPQTILEIGHATVSHRLPAARTPPPSPSEETPVTSSVTQPTELSISCCTLAVRDLLASASAATVSPLTGATEPQQQQQQQRSRQCAGSASC